MGKRKNSFEFCISETLLKTVTKRERIVRRSGFGSGMRIQLSQVKEFGELYIWLKSQSASLLRLIDILLSFVQK